MNLANPNMTGLRPVIRQLDEGAINRIAAGEVVERPASAVKELVENALDAGARRITVDYADGGKTLIRVTDDGCGMTADDLPLALSRHATSKINGADLLAITSFGFRGEALPSLAAVGRLTVTSRAEGATGASLAVAGGQAAAVRPAGLARGTVVELRDLFFATPARLKFLRSDRAEAQAIGEVMRRLALAEPLVGFTLRDLSGGSEGRVMFRADAPLIASPGNSPGDLLVALAGRAAQVLGPEFAANTVQVDVEQDGLRLFGLAGLPACSRGSSVAQFVFVNGRPVLDRMLMGALRAAYFDVLPRDRHAAAVLRLEVDPQRVDVNVHPAKSEVRFREPALARGLIVTGVKAALAGTGCRAVSTLGTAAAAALRPAAFGARVYQMDRPAAQVLRQAHLLQAPQPGQAAVGFNEGPSARIEAEQGGDFGPLGAVKAQVHGTYIIAQTPTGMVIVDAHAAHERLIYERLKRQMAGTGIAAQALLIPEIVDLSPGDAACLLALAPDLARLGLVIEPFGGSAVAVRETPAILGPVEAGPLLRDVLDEVADAGASGLIQARIDAVLARIACHGSVRSGRALRADEMNALLREIEATPNSGTCNHGRPTHVELRLADLDRLFGRT